MSAPTVLDRPARRSAPAANPEVRRSRPPRERPSSYRTRPERPPLDRSSLRRRLQGMRIALLVAAAAFVLRLVDVQVVRSSHYTALSRAQLAETVTLPAERGGIYDRDGEVLAESVPAKMVVADPFLITHEVAAEASALSGPLGVPVSSLTSKLSEDSGYVVLAGAVSADVAKQIGALDLPGINLLDTSVREDPDGSLAAPLLGGVNASGAGAAGLEEELNSMLAGVPGSEDLLQAPNGAQLPGGDLQSTPAKPGEGAELTIDEPLQYVTEQALGAEIGATGAKSGIAIVMDVKTGQILSMANLVATGSAPSGSPAPAPGGVDALPAGVSEAPQNLALTSVYEPGSVFKIVTFSAALAQGLITPDEDFSVPDALGIDGSLFHDADPHPVETMTATDILAQSSNIGTTEVAQKLGEAGFLQQVQALGFGRPTGLDYPGESSGLLISADQWEPTDIASGPIGQDDAVTAQQMLDAMNTVANGGIFVAPKLLRATVAPDGTVKPTPPSPSHRAIPPAADQELTSMLTQVVANGTGQAASIDGYAVAGKTGTAEMPNPNGDGYETGAYMATFDGFAPAVDPVLSAIVILQQPTPIFGGSVAAPVFSQIMGYALHRYGIPSTPGATTVPGGTSASAGLSDGGTALPPGILSSPLPGTDGATNPGTIDRSAKVATEGT